MRKALFGIAAALLCLGIAHAQLYKWVDKDGKVHYSDKPPPKGTKSQELAPPPKTAAEAPKAETAKPGAAPVQKQDRVRTQFDFAPEEQQALRMLCAIQTLQTKTCRPVIQRNCTVDELLGGVPGRPGRSLTRDPRKDPNYEYRFSGGRKEAFAVAANPRKSGLYGFVAMKDGTHYNSKGTATGKDAKVQGALVCPDYVKL